MPPAIGNSDQTQPVPKKIQIGGKSYSLVAFYYPDAPTSWDVVYHAGCFGNFYPSPLTLDHPNPETGEKLVPTPAFHIAEAAFQALKWWANEDIRKSFEAATTGDEAYKRSKDQTISPDLTYAGLGNRLAAMELVLRQKYSQNSDLKSALLATGDAYLLEHAAGFPKKTFWNDGGRGKAGRNMLGRTLMRLRREFGGHPAPAGTDDDAFVALAKAEV